MMSAPIEIVVPRVNANDEHASLVRWLRPPASWVDAGQAVVQIETSKATVDLEAPTAGYLAHLFEVGAILKIGEAVGRIMDSAEAAHGPPLRPAMPMSSRSNRAISTKARILLENLNIAPDDIPGSGPITETAVSQFLAARPNANEQQRFAELRIEIGENAVVLFGAANQGAVVLDCLRASGAYEPLCFVDASPKAESFEGLPLFGQGVLGALRARGARHAHVCIGDPKGKIRVAELLRKEDFSVVNAIHPRACVSPSAQIGQGVYIGPLAIVGPNAVVRDLAQVNNGAIVAHDAQVGMAARLADGVRLAGGVRVGDRSYLGLGVTVNTDCHIGADTTIVSGVSIFDAVADGVIVRHRKTLEAS